MAIGCCESQAQPQPSLNTPSSDDTDRCSTASSAGSYACGEDVRPGHIGQTSQKQEPNCNLGLPRFAYVSENGYRKSPEGSFASLIFIITAKPLDIPPKPGFSIHL
jgi:hypothetical protein